MDDEPGLTDVALAEGADEPVVAEAVAAVDDLSRGWFGLADRPHAAVVATTARTMHSTATRRQAAERRRAAKRQRLAAVRERLAAVRPGFAAVRPGFGASGKEGGTGTIQAVGPDGSSMAESTGHDHARRDAQAVEARHPAVTPRRLKRAIPPALARAIPPAPPGLTFRVLAPPAPAVARPTRVTPSNSAVEDAMT